MLARIPATAAPELELKFQLGPHALEALQGEAFPIDPARTSRLHAVYFDTPSHTLRDGAFSLRVRQKGERYVQTLKQRTAGDLFQRDEWETEVEGPDLDRAALASTPAAEAIGDATLAPAFTVEVERQVHDWVRGDTRIEVSFDTGLITAGERQEPVSEMELELLAGPPEALFELARELLAKAPLTLSFESKAERGYRLLGHDGVAALRAQRIAVRATTRGADAF
jgi:inorganic triphosphatase YgiF